MVFVVGAQTTNILPTNESTLLTFTCSASSNHENITHEMSLLNTAISCKRDKGESVTSAAQVRAIVIIIIHV